MIVQKFESTLLIPRRLNVLRRRQRRRRCQHRCRRQRHCRRERRCRRRQSLPLGQADAIEAFQACRRLDDPGSSCSPRGASRPWRSPAATSTSQPRWPLPEGKKLTCYFAPNRRYVYTTPPRGTYCKTSRILFLRHRGQIKDKLIIIVIFSP